MGKDKATEAQRTQIILFPCRLARVPPGDSGGDSLALCDVRGSKESREFLWLTEQVSAACPGSSSPHPPLVLRADVWARDTQGWGGSWKGLWLQRARPGKVGSPVRTLLGAKGELGENRRNRACCLPKTWAGRVGQPNRLLHFGPSRLVPLSDPGGLLPLGLDTSYNRDLAMFHTS